MLFSSYVFIFIFFPITIISYFLLSKINSFWGKLILIFSSLIFYAYYSIKFLMLLLVSVIINYVIAFLLSNKKNNGTEVFKNVIFAIGVVINLVILCFYKYSPFFLSLFNSLFAKNICLSIAFPLAISFYTFQQILYLYSLYKGNSTLWKLQDYVLYVVFFPKLLQGPICFPEDFNKEIQNINHNFNSENCVKGLYIFSIGLFKKVLIADTFAVFVNNGYLLEAVTMPTAWIISLCYTIQLYFDFSGYSDMAIGVAKILNFDLPVNFNSPYKSESVTEFWKRWHITLGKTLSKLIYIPLGGNRKGLVRTCLNLFMVFFVSGIWHGNSMQFVCWGILYGLIVLFERIFNDKLKKIPHIIRVLFTFLIVNFLWVLFRSNDVETAIRLYKSMFDFSSFSYVKLLVELSAMAFDSVMTFPAVINVLYIIGLLLAAFVLIFGTRNSIEKMDRMKISVSSLVFTTILFTASILAISRGSVFIYFNF